jgi:hypothetical protein
MAILATRTKGEATNDLGIQDSVLGRSLPPRLGQSNLR